MPQQYRGMSSFFDTPAGKALMQAGSPQPRVAAGGGDDGVMATMRPSLRNALADAYGENALRDLRRRQPTRIEYRDGPAAGAFGDRPEFYIPETMDPIANAEEARHQFRSNFQTEEPLVNQQQQRDLRNRADADNYAAGLEDRRYWDPYAVGRREDEHSRRMSLATEPARIAAGSRENVASTTGSSRVGAAAATASGRVSQEALRSFDDWVKSGAFGYDERGYPKAAPPEVSNVMQRFMMQGAGEKFDPESEAQIKIGVDAGHSREEVIAFLRSQGRIR